ncbi:adhesion G protein-coupled receptor E5-like [Physella acuta]|uniref:adhesion G protein-coupled receptor E5-like n=1 Tax=Physella acuta TaxID=109671 RepID=UPI0027DB2507|nr:adhesion G protein-coupled receptor E5-like [Physella acuta]
MAVVITLDLIFLIITIVKIQSFRQQHSSDGRNTDLAKCVFIYAKLSTLTGVFWTLAIISEALDSVWLRYVSILLNGLQGVFLFVSCVCNKRVLELYLRAFDREESPRQ